MTDVLFVVPTRLASTRFPRKALERINGLPLFLHAAFAAMGSKPRSSCGRVVVACPVYDLEIIETAEEFGIEVVTTGEADNGTERCALVAQKLGWRGRVVNIQGDQVFLDQMNIILAATARSDVATILGNSIPRTLWDDESIVKAVLYPKTSGLVFVRNMLWIEDSRDVRFHHGIYSYTREALDWYLGTESTAVEVAMGLEQLRWPRSGYFTMTALRGHGCPVEINVLSDLEAVELMLEIGQP